MATISAASHIVTLFISAEDAKSERRFQKSLSIVELKEKLEPITGVPCATMKLSLFANNSHVCDLNE
jgi:tubulin-folding cofactor B